MSFEDIAKKRASIRRYSDKKPKIETVIQIIETANLAPSPGNMAIVKYLIIKEKDTIDKIAEACRQNFIADAPYLVLICSELKEVESAYEARGKKYLKQHVGAVIENMLLEITDLGLASCWIGAFSDLTIKNLLKIPDNIEIEAIIPIAYQLKIDKTVQKKKHSLTPRLFFESYGNKFLKPFKKIGT